MAINVLTKTPSEARRFKFDCGKALGPEEKITGNIRIVITPLGRIKEVAPLRPLKHSNEADARQDGNVIDARPRYTNDAVYVFLSGGKDEEDYRVSVTFATNISSSVEVFGDLRVRSQTPSGQAGTD